MRQAQICFVFHSTFVFCDTTRTHGVAECDLSSTPWNPDRPIDDLWASVCTIRRITEDGNASITEVSTISLLLDMFETSGLLSSTTEKFRLSEPSSWTCKTFKREITRGNAKPLHQLTTGSSGYHGALAAYAPPAAGAQVAKPCPTVTNIVCDGIQLYYCWSHGVSGYANHTSCTRMNRKAGHIASATLSNQQGGGSTPVSLGSSPLSLLRFAMSDVLLLLTQSMTRPITTSDNGGSLLLEKSN
jgi:hypothetical protein